MSADAPCAASGADVARGPPAQAAGSGAHEARPHWVVRLNWRNRTWSFALAFGVLGTYLGTRHAGGVEWALLALQFLAYPHLAYWRARRSASTLRAEMQNLLLDAVLLGMWVAYWGFPLWIGFMLAIGACLNLMIFRGLPGLRAALLAFAAGSAAMLLFAGPRFHPDTGLLTAFLCMALLSAYLLMFAHAAYGRGVSLRESRERMGEQLEQITSLQGKLREQALRDPLTGLYNRRHFDQVLAQALADCRARGRPLSLAMIDIDHFKQINDRYGHPGGDEMLLALAQALGRHARGSDTTCRFGGEEFLWMMPATSPDEALRLVDAMRAEFAATDVAAGSDTMRARLSCGVAGVPAHGNDAVQLLQATDKALYAAKQQGRDRVVSAG